MQLVIDHLKQENNAIKQQVRDLLAQKDELELECKQELKLMNIRNNDLSDKLARQSHAEGADF